MSDITPNPDPDPIPEFDFNALTADTVSPEEAPPSFAPPRKASFWEKMFGNNSKNGAKKERKVKTRTLAPMPRGGLRGPLEEMYTSLGMLVMVADASCGKAIIEAAPRCAESLDNLAKTNPAVRRILISLVTTNAMGAVIMAHAPIIMAIAMHHVPWLRERQEKMVSEFAEMMANMPMPKPEGD